MRFAVTFVQSGRRFRIKRIACDVGVHHIHLCDLDIGFFDSNARMTPPLRSQRDREAIELPLCQ